MKKVVWVSVVIVIASFVMLSEDPLNGAVNFLIAGTLPGTSISIGFWPTMLLVLLLAIGVKKGIQNARHKMIISEVEKAEIKKAKATFKEANEIEFDRSKRAVIAAPKSEVAL